MRPDPHVPLFIITQLMLGPLSMLPLPFMGVEGYLYVSIVGAMIDDMHRAVHMSGGR